MTDSKRTSNHSTFPRFDLVCRVTPLTMTIRHLIGDGHHRHQLISQLKHQNHACLTYATYEQKSETRETKDQISTQTKWILFWVDTFSSHYGLDSESGVECCGGQDEDEEYVLGEWIVDGMSVYIETAVAVGVHGKVTNVTSSNCLHLVACKLIQFVCVLVGDGYKQRWKISQFISSCADIDRFHLDYSIPLGGEERVKISSCTRGQKPI